MINSKRIVLLIIILHAVFSLHSQTRQAEALSLFREGNYAGAAAIYAPLLERNSRDVTMNYYYGVCLYYLNEDKYDAIRRLRLSSSRPVSPDVFYYLGKLYQQTYEMQTAVEQFERFLNLNKTESPKVDDAKIALENCRSAENLVNKYFNIETLRKDTIEKSRLLDYIHLSEDAGELMTSGKFFLSGVDANQIIFKTERGNEVLFPAKETGGTWNLYRIVKLLDSWNDPQPLDAPVNSEDNEFYPFLLIDGVTLYFSSDRPGGMGKLDIYQSFFDSETGTFSEPANLGPPFNSPEDDFLLVPDVYAGRAWFATNREIGNDSIVVVEINWDETVIKNNTENASQLYGLSKLPLSEKAVAPAGRTQPDAKNNKEKTTVDEIRFAVNDTLSYTRFGQFRSNDALSSYKSGHKAEQKKDSLLQLLDTRRRTFSQSYNQTEINSLTEQIMQLERQTYGLDDEINRYYLSARRIESEKISQLVKEGNYNKPEEQSQPSVKEKKEDKNNQETTNRPLFAGEDFEIKAAQLQDLYDYFFTNKQIKQLQRADSLYMQANIANLEAVRLLEQTRQIPDTSNEITGMGTVELINNSRELKKQSFELYEESFDIKYNIYYPAALELNTTNKNTSNEYLLKQVYSDYAKAGEIKAGMILYSQETIEQILTSKKLSVNKLEATLKIQKASGAILTIRDEAIIDNTNKTHEITLPYKNQPEYKIQIGIFRNTPDPKAIGKIPSITKELLPESGLTKYFSGSWSKYEDAQNMVKTIRNAGFPGAFVVAFIDGAQVDLEKAKNREK